MFIKISKITILKGASIIVVPNSIGQAVDVEALKVFIGVVLFIIIVTLPVILLVIVVHIVDVIIFRLLQRVLPIIFLHDLHVHLVVDHVALGLDLMLPGVIVDLDVVEDGIDKYSNVRVLIREEFEHDGDHLSLVQNHFSRGSKEEELEEGVEDLLDHLVVFLLGTKHVLEQLN